MHSFEFVPHSFGGYILWENVLGSPNRPGYESKRLGQPAHMSIIYQILFLQIFFTHLIHFL